MWNCINLSSVLAIVNAILCLLISSIVSYLFHLIWIYVAFGIIHFQNVVNSTFVFCIQIKHNIDRSLLTWKNFQHNECFFFVDVKKTATEEEIWLFVFPVVGQLRFLLLNKSSNIDMNIGINREFWNPSSVV